MHKYWNKEGFRKRWQTILVPFWVKPEQVQFSVKPTKRIKQPSPLQFICWLNWYARPQAGRKPDNPEKLMETWKFHPEEDPQRKKIHFKLYKAMPPVWHRKCKHVASSKYCFSKPNVVATNTTLMSGSDRRWAIFVFCFFITACSKLLLLFFY